MVVLKELILTISTLGGVVVLKETPFYQFLPMEGVMVLKELICKFLCWECVVVVKELIFKNLYFGQVWWS